MPTLARYPTIFDIIINEPEWGWAWWNSKRELPSKHRVRLNHPERLPDRLIQHPFDPA
jgi:hypothetical protein